jgi:hypothetical protein
VICLTVALTDDYDVYDADIRTVDFLNLLYSPKAAFKLLHTLHHLNGVLFDNSYNEYALNPSITSLLSEYAHGSRFCTYRIYSKLHRLNQNSLELGSLIGLEESKEGRMRKRRFEDGRERFIRAREIWVPIYEPHNLHHVLWLLSNGGPYSRKVSVRVGTWATQTLMELVAVSTYHLTYRIESSLLVSVREIPPPTSYSANPAPRHGSGHIQRPPRSRDPTRLGEFPVDAGKPLSVPRTSDC